MKKLIKIVFYIGGLCLIIGLGFVAEVGVGGIMTLQKDVKQVRNK